MKGGIGKSLVYIHKTRQWDSEKDGKGGSVRKKNKYFKGNGIYSETQRERERERESEREK